MTYRVRVTPKADALIDELDAWWSENRPSSTAHVASEVVRTLLLLTEMPGVGAIYQRRKGRVIRRVQLQGTPYFLYYVVNDDAGELVVISAWSGARGRGPRL